MIADTVFCLRGHDGAPVYNIIVRGQVIAADFADRGAAYAGLATEQRRAAAAAARPWRPERIAREPMGGK
jgi:hypothetical protein